MATIMMKNLESVLGIGAKNVIAAVSRCPRAVLSSNVNVKILIMLLKDYVFEFMCR